MGPTWASSTTWLVADSENVTSEDITLHGAGDMAFLESGGKCGHTYRRIKLTRDQTAWGVKRRPPGLISSNVDAFHSWSCGAGPVLEGSNLSFAGDDQINIHGQLFVAAGALGGTSADPRHGELIVVDFGDAVYDPLGPRARLLSTFKAVSAGDHLEFYAVQKSPVPVPPGGNGVKVAKIERARDPELVAAALALPTTLQKPPFNVGVFPLVRPPFVKAGAFPLVYKVTLAGDAGKAVAASVAHGGLMWTQFPARCGPGALVRNNTLMTTYDHVARVSSDGFRFERNSVHCRSPDPGFAVNVMCLPDWLQAKFSLRNISFVSNSMRGCGTVPSAVFSASPGDCTAAVDGLIIANNSYN